MVFPMKHFKDYKPRLLLQMEPNISRFQCTRNLLEVICICKIQGYRQVVRHGILIPAFVGSNPTNPARGEILLMRIDYTPFYYAQILDNIFLKRTRTESAIFPSFSHFSIILSIIKIKPKGEKIRYVKF